MRGAGFPFIEDIPDDLEIHYQETPREHGPFGAAGVGEGPLTSPHAAIVNAIRIALERTPPELSADIIDRGIILTGGGALLKNLDKRIREETQLPVFITEDPLTTVVLGAGKMLDELELLKKISLI